MDGGDKLGKMKEERRTKREKNWGKWREMGAVGEEDKCMEERSGLGLFLNRVVEREGNQAIEMRHTVLLFVSPNWG